MRTTVVDIPFSHLARGTAPRARGEKWHKVIGTVPVAVRTLDAPDRSVTVSFGPQQRAFPVVGNRLLHPLSVLDHSGGWLNSGEPLRPDAVAGQVVAAIEQEHEHHAGRWDGAPVDLSCGSYDGRVVRDGTLRSVSVSDREERMALAAERAAADVILVGGVLCASGREPIFGFAMNDGSPKARTVEPVHLRRALRSQLVDRGQGCRSSEFCCGLRGLARLLEEGPVLPLQYASRRNGDVLSISSSLEGIDWSGNDAEFSMANALSDVCAMVDRIPGGPVHLPDALIDVALRSTRTVLRWTGGSGAGTSDLVEAWGGFADVVRGGGMTSAGIPDQFLSELEDAMAAFEARASLAGLLLGAPSAEETTDLSL